jgi:hypothetical protein
VEPVALTGVYKNVRRGIVALVFRCTVVGQATPLSDEVSEIGWLPPDDLDRMGEAYRVRLLDAIDSSAPHVRTHDGVQLIAPRP